MVSSMHTILNSHFKCQAEVRIAQSRGIKRKQVSPDKQASLNTPDRRGSDDIGNQLGGKLVECQTYFIL